MVEREKREDREREQRQDRDREKRDKRELSSSEVLVSSEQLGNGSGPKRRD